MKRKIVIFTLVLSLIIPLSLGSVHAAPEEIAPNQLPGDFSNNCKIIKTYNNNNVKFNKSSEIVARTTLGIIGALLPFKRLLSKIGAGAAGANAVIPKDKNVWTTTQVRECKDHTGIHTSLIIKYYAGSKRSKFLYIQTVKVN